MIINPLSRRRFLQYSAAAGAGLAAQLNAAQSAPASNNPTSSAPADRVRFGMVGIGMQGSALLTESVKLPGVECAAACDLYDGRHLLAREIVRPDLPVTRRYEDLLGDKSIQCIVAAVPDHWHRSIVTDAVSAGKDIYCEKPMSHSAEDGVKMVAAVKQTKQIVQIGSQRVSSQICKKAKEIIAQGHLGELTLVEGWLGRNDPTGAWVYPPPTDLSPQNLDWNVWQGTAPKRPFSPERFARWRCWRDYGTGVAGDLLVHLISGMLFMLDRNEPPTQAMSVGGIRVWKDGRDMPDVQATTFYYGDLPVYMRLNQGTEMPETYRFQGSRGILEVTEFGLTFAPQSGQDTAPSYYDQGFPSAMRREYEKQWHAAHTPAIGQEPMPETISYRGPDYDDVKPHLWNFFEAVRSRQPVVEDVVFGHHAALACHMANESYFRKKLVTWDQHSQTIRS